MSVFLAYLMVALLAALVGFSELLTRYRDDPMKLTGYTATIVYCAINASAAILALGVVRALDLTFGFAATDNIVYWLQILAAGTSAMVLLRTSVAKVRVHGVDVAIGPQAFLDALQAAADRQVDRRRAKDRESVVTPLMEDVDFDTASKILPPYCFQLLQNSSPGEEAAVAAEVLKYRELDLPDSVKARLLGLMLLSVVGKEVLKEAVDSLRPLLRLPAARSQTLSPRGQSARRKLDAYLRHLDGGSSTESDRDAAGGRSPADAVTDARAAPPETPTSGSTAAPPSALATAPQAAPPDDVSR